MLALALACAFVVLLMAPAVAQERPRCSGRVA